MTAEGENTGAGKTANLRKERRAPKEMTPAGENESCKSNAARRRQLEEKTRSVRDSSPEGDPTASDDKKAFG